jgi:hypothetical protein
VIEDDKFNAHEALTDTEPALAELAVAATLDRVPAGPALRQQDPIRLSPGRELEYPKGLCATAHGFSLHAATTARADDAIGREALCKCIFARLSLKRTSGFQATTWCAFSSNVRGRQQMACSRRSTGKTAD